jgi:hypothetical protein
METVFEMWAASSIGPTKLEVLNMKTLFEN